jgi:hypothetical protein
MLEDIYDVKVDNIYQVWHDKLLKHETPDKFRKMKDQIMKTDFFLDAPTELELLATEVKRLREQSEKVRKGQYAKIGELAKMYEETIHELNTLKAAICHCQKFDPLASNEQPALIRIK